MIDKYKYTEKEQNQILKSITILVDTREKNNQHILKYFNEKKIPYIERALSQGDYSFMLPKNESLSIFRDIYYDKEIVIERKANLDELSGNLSQQRDRFEKELSLYKGHMTLLIENANYKDICSGNYNTEYNPKSYLGSLHSFSHRYNLPIMFMPDNNYSGIYILSTFYYYLRNILK